MSDTQRLAVTIHEAAALLSLSPRTVQKYVYIGCIPARRIGRRRLILVGDLERFLLTDHPKPSPRPDISSANEVRA